MRGDVENLKNKFWVKAKDPENRPSYPFRATCVEHDKSRMYITASFVQDPDPEKDAYERIDFPLDIQAWRDIALAIRRLAQTSPR